jgi:membrane-associated phospholipid phosphatase
MSSSKSLGPTDRIAFAYAIALGALAALSGAQPPALVVVAATFAAVVVAIARRASVSRRWGVVHDFAVIGFVPVLYELSGPVVAEVNSRRWDEHLAALDRAWFGALPAAWVGLFGRPDWLIEAASILYASYYLIPIAIAVALYRQDRRAEFHAFVFTVTATFLASYCGYFLAPAAGPRVAAGDVSVLGGEAMGGWLRAFLAFFEWNHLDAFPSGHTSLSLVYLALGWRLVPRWRLPLAAATVGIIFSTVYLSLHYVVDLVAGAMVAAVMLVAGPVLYRFLLGDRSPRVEPAELRVQRSSSNARQAPSAQPIRAKRPPR